MYQGDKDIVVTQIDLDTPEKDFETKNIRVYVDKDIEFTVEIKSRLQTCGWLL